MRTKERPPEYFRRPIWENCKKRYSERSGTAAAESEAKAGGNEEKRRGRLGYKISVNGDIVKREVLRGGRGLKVEAEADGFVRCQSRNAGKIDGKVHVGRSAVVGYQRCRGRAAVYRGVCRGVSRPCEQLIAGGECGFIRENINLPCTRSLVARQRRRR